MNKNLEFQTKVELAVEKYLSKKNLDSVSRRNSNHDIVIDKYVEKDRIIQQLSTLVQQISKLTANQLLEPIKNHVDSLEQEVQKLKELILKSFQDNFNPIKVQEQSAQSPSIEVSDKELDKLKKKLQNQQNLVNLLMENQTQLKQQISQQVTQQNNSATNNTSNDDQVQKLLDQLEQRMILHRKEFADMVNDGVRQIKEKGNACWVVLGDLNTRVEKMESAFREANEQKTPEKRSLFKKASSLFQNHN